jgi:hypothetical protein
MLHALCDLYGLGGLLHNACTEGASTFPSIRYSSLIFPILHGKMTDR